MNKFISETDSFAGSSIHISKIVQGTHIKGILRKGDELFKPHNKIKLLEVEDLPIKIEIYSHSIDISLLENRTSEIISSTYMTSVGDIVGNYSILGNGTLLMINGCVLGVIWVKNCFFLFESHSKNSSGNICQNGTSVLLKFETLTKLQGYVKDIYYVGLKHETLYFQIQFINLLCSSEEMKVIKSKVALERRLNFQKQKYAINVELKKKNHQAKLFAHNKSSVVKEEKSKKNEDKLKLFKKKIWEGPYFSCTICH